MFLKTMLWLFPLAAWSTLERSAWLEVNFPADKCHLLSLWKTGPNPSLKPPGKKKKKKKKESIIKFTHTQWEALDSIWQLNMPRTLQSIRHHLAARSCQTASTSDILQGPSSYPCPLQALNWSFPAISPFHRQGTCRLQELSFSLSFMIRLHHPLCGLLPSCALQEIHLQVI